MPIIPALGRLRQEDHKLKTSPGCTARFCFKKKFINKIWMPVPSSYPPGHFFNDLLKMKAKLIDIHIQTGIHING
jgi:hypothetical protein